MSHILKNPLCPATQVMGKDQHQGRGNPTFYECINTEYTDIAENINKEFIP